MIKICLGTPLELRDLWESTEGSDVFDNDWNKPYNQTTFFAVIINGRECHSAQVCISKSNESFINRDFNFLWFLCGSSRVIKALCFLYSHPFLNDLLMKILLWKPKIICQNNKASCVKSRKRLYGTPRNFYRPADPNDW